MKPWKFIVLRLVIACFFGGIVTGIALSAGRREAENSILEYPQQKTLHILPVIVQAVETYRQKNHSLPRSLNQLETGTGDGGYYQYLDGWGHPFVYIVQGTHYRVVSYGQDGTPGGTGWDADISSDNPHPPPPQMTFHNFFTNPYTQDMVKTAYISGALAGLLCWVTVRPKTFTWRSTLGLTVQIVATLVAAAWVAMVITALHVPSGH